jgi:hypothetical protein
MIDAELLRVWLDAVPNELSLPFRRGPRPPEFANADRIGIVTMLEGPGERLEGAGDMASFQLRLVAREFETEKLRRSAFAIDSALRFGDWPLDVWGTHVISVDRAGGAPSELQEDELDRVAYVCTYNALETI